jgi:hypothetical protein
MEREGLRVPQDYPVDLLDWQDRRDLLAHQVFQESLVSKASKANKDQKATKEEMVLRVLKVM